MKLTLEQRDQVFKEYMLWVASVSEDLEDKSYFHPEEIVMKVLEIVEEMEELK